MKEVSLDHFFTALGNKQRVHILQLLTKHGPHSVLGIASELKAEQSAVSHNLRQLLICHFVTVNQNGKERIYAINKDTVEPIFKLIGKHISRYCVEQCSHKPLQTVKIKSNQSNKVDLVTA